MGAGFRYLFGAKLPLGIVWSRGSLTFLRISLHHKICCSLKANLELVIRSHVIFKSGCKIKQLLLIVREDRCWYNLFALYGTHKRFHQN